MSRYEIRYNTCKKYIEDHKIAFILLKIIYKYMAFFIAAAYILLIFLSITGYTPVIHTAPILFRNSIIKLDTYGIVLTFKLILVPMSSFILLTVLRQCLNAKRPYEKYDIEPIFQKNTKGNSMPSRHVFSITIISMCYLYVYPIVGLVFLCLSLIMAASRVFAGVHFFRDVLVGFLFGIASGLIGFWIF